MSRVVTSQRRGHTPTLIASFLHFDLSFMLWVLIGALSAIISKDLQLSPAQKGALVAVPILTGSITRIPLGHLADRHGSRRVALLMLAWLFLPLSLAAFAAKSFASLLVVGALLGVAGASFAVALPLASRWYPPGRQGIVLGIAAAGNSGVAVANLVAPALARKVGWHGVFAWAMLPLAAVLVAFAALAREAPPTGARTPQGYRALLRERDLWWLCLFYGVTFGGYVGLTGFLPTFFCDQHATTPMVAGTLTATIAVAGSAIRPVGGWLADRFGGVRLLQGVFAALAVLWAMCAALPSLRLATVIFVATAIALGTGNGAVFQLVPQRFRDRIGLAAGVVGALGGVAGFFLPTLLGTTKQLTGSFATAFLVLSFAAACALFALRAAVSGFRTPAPIAEAPGDAQ